MKFDFYNKKCYFRSNYIDSCASQKRSEKMMAMDVAAQIKTYIESQEASKREALQFLHDHILTLFSNNKLWFLDGKDTAGKVVSNPNIGYGKFKQTYKDGSTKEFYQVGISGNTTGISIYIMGLREKTYLPRTFGTTIGKATVTGYCIKFKKLSDINMAVLDDAIRYGISQTQ